MHCIRAIVLACGLSRASPRCHCLPDDLSFSLCACVVCLGRPDARAAARRARRLRLLQARHRLRTQHACAYTYTNWQFVRVGGSAELFSCENCSLYCQLNSFTAGVYCARHSYSYSYSTVQYTYINPHTSRQTAIKLLSLCARHSGYCVCESECRALPRLTAAVLREAECIRVHCTCRCRECRTWPRASCFSSRRPTRSCASPICSTCRCISRSTGSTSSPYASSASASVTSLVLSGLVWSGLRATGLEFRDRTSLASDFSSRSPVLAYSLLYLLM